MCSQLLSHASPFFFSFEPYYVAQANLESIQLSFLGTQRITPGQECAPTHRIFGTPVAVTSHTQMSLMNLPAQGRWREQEAVTHTALVSSGPHCQAPEPGGARLGTGTTLEGSSPPLHMGHRTPAVQPAHKQRVRSAPSPTPLLSITSRAHFGA